jgi:hypothetical protein
MHIGKVIGDVDVGNCGQKVDLSQNHWREPVRKGPQEYDDGACQIGWRAEGQGDCEKSPKAARSLNFGGFFKAGIYGGETCGKTENDKREHVQGLNEYQSVQTVDEIYGRLDQSRFRKEQIQSSKPAEKNDKCKYAGISGQHNRQKD